MYMTAAGETRAGDESSAAVRRPLLAKTVEFTEGAARPAQFPRPRRAEIALAGRSNVGKSSLLNRLVHRTGIARVSKTPGRTQQINFFLIDGTWCLVDLPGYGFARVPTHVRESWQGLVEAYLRRKTLRGVVVIVDLRRGLQLEDEQLLSFLKQRGVRICIAATKADKVARGQRKRHVDAVRQAATDVVVVVCSAATAEGVSELGAVMRGWLEGN